MRHRFVLAAVVVVLLSAIIGVVLHLELAPSTVPAAVRVRVQEPIQDAAPPPPVHRPAAPRSEPPPPDPAPQPTPAEAVPAPPPPPPRRQITLRTRDREDHPVAGARYVARRSGVADPLIEGTTDGNGEAVLSWEEALGDVGIEVTRRGYADATASVPAKESVARAEPPTRLDLMLLPGGRITGDLGANGPTSGAGASFTVIAWPRRRGLPSPKDLDASRIGAPGVRTTECRIGSAFAFEDLEDGDAYSLYVAGRGWLQVAGHTAGAATARAGGAPVHLMVAPLYVMDVSVSDEQGTPIVCGDGLRLGGSIAPPPGAVGPIAVDNPSVTLAWPDALAVRAARRPPGFLQAYAVASDSESIGPMKARIGAAGYETVTTELRLFRCRGPSAPTQEIRLKRWSDGFGSVELSVAYPGIEVGTDVGARETSAVQVSLRYVAKSPHPETTLTIDVPLFRRSMVIEGVPCGEYLVAWSCGLAHHSLTEPTRIQVAKGEATHLGITVEGASTLEVKMQTRVSGVVRDYSGPATVIVCDSLSNHSVVPAFRRPPYLVVGIPPSTYLVRVITGADAAEVTDVRVLPNETRSISVELEPERR